ncbi:hypothetical protein [Streptomyces antarcticus]|uniref:hypothetical protein n=2 Tax=Streptomyces antarcticus TaxID=2996458 RepID=UPI00226E8920|nr:MULTISPECIES: hypothetical protein [unclassified Streptomyces]MCY0945478.1 hypothetical protein [Streptomyces sp. H34-AA3]MCY0953127.1 hypothetical protein [Streptomyces sp. H27-S2]MCZ4083599.1 hypothetical protein [Streptomyces sp. H34-S5]
MPGQHARPASTMTPAAPAAAERPPRPDGSRHARRGRRLAERLRRKIFAYRDIDFLTSHHPRETGNAESCLLLVHIRKVVGQVRYRICPSCAEAVITGIEIEDRFRSAGLGNRALAHLRSRHPGLNWRSTSAARPTRDFLRRMGIPVTGGRLTCSHVSEQQPGTPRRNAG